MNLVYMKYFTLSAFAITSGLCGSSGGGGGGKSMEHVASSSVVVTSTNITSKSKSSSTITKSKSITRATTTTALLTVFAVFLGLALGAGAGMAEITLPAAFAQQTSATTFDFEFPLNVDGSFSKGITSLNGKIYVSESADDTIYAYNADGTRDADSDIALNSSNGIPAGITSLYGKLWVLDNSNTKKVFVYHTNGTRDEDSDFSISSPVGAPSGITALNGKLWVTDFNDKKIYAYDPATGSRDGSSTINLTSTNGLADGITSLHGKFWVVDRSDGKVYVYNADESYDPFFDFNLHPDNGSPKGITSLNGKLWVTDDGTDKVYVYDVPPPPAYDFDLDSSNNEPHGITSLHGKFYVVDRISGTDDKIYAYNADGTRAASLDFDLNGNNPRGITSLHGQFYVVDSSTTKKIHAYNATGTRISDFDITLDSDNSNPTGITAFNNKFYVVDTATSEETVYIYDPDGTLGGTFDLQSNNSGSQGITTLNGQFYVSDTDNTVYVYDSDGTPKPSLNFDQDSGNNTDSRGITSLNGKLWVVDSDDTVYAYNADGTKDVNPNIDLGADNILPSGITATLDGKLWVVDGSDTSVFEYNAADGTRDGDFNLALGNAAPNGITTLNDKFYIVDETDTFVYAYNSDGIRNTGSEFNLASGNAAPNGITSLNSKFWVSDDTKVFAYNAADGTQASTFDFDLDLPSNVGSPSGITALNGKLWVIAAPVIQVYNAADGTKVASLDFALSAENSSPQGITTLHGKMWVVDSIDDIIYSYNAPAPSNSIRTMSQSWSEDYDAVLNDDGTTTDVSVTFTDTSPFFDSNDTYTAKLFITQHDTATIAYSDVQQVTGITPTFSVAHADISLDYEKGVFLIIETYSSEDPALNNWNVVAVKGKDNARTNFPPVIDPTLTDFSTYVTLSYFGTSLNNDGTTDVSINLDEVYSIVSAYTAKLFLYQDSQLVYFDEQDTVGVALDFNVAHSDLMLDYTKDVTVRIEVDNANSYLSWVIPAADVPATFPFPDSVAPTLTAVSITSDNTDDSTLAIPGNVVRLSFTSDEPILFSSVAVTINGDRAGISGDGGTIWNAERTIRPADNAGTVTFTIDYSDYSSNAGDTVTGVDTGNTNVSINQVTLPSDQEIELIRSDLAVAASATSAASAVGTIEITQDNTSDFDLDSQNTNPRGITAANDKIYVADLSDDVYVYDPADDGSRVTSLDFELASKNGSPSGMTELDGKFYVVDDVRDKIYVYNSDGTRDNASSDINLNFANEHPTGIAAHEGDLWVVDNDDSKVYVYNTGRSYVETSNFDLDAENSSPQGITSLYGKLWVTDSTDDQVYAYNTDGTRDDTSDFDLGSANSNPRGITASDGMFYVSDDVDHKVYAYSAVIVVRDETSDFDLDADNVSSRGITSINGKLWVVDWTDQKIYAYNTDGGTRDSASDITLDTNNANSNGITALDGKFYVVDSADNKVYVYNTDGTTRDATLDFNLDGANNIQSSGITAYNGKLWITDNSFGAGKIYVYDTDGTIDSDSNFVLDADNINPAGITSINGKLWVLDEIDDKVYVYNPDGTRDSSLDFDLDADNLIPNGITSINGKLWVADVNDDKVYVYNYAKGIEFGIDGLYANTPYKYTTTKCDVTAPGTNAADFDSCSDSVTSEKDSDSTGTLAINVDGPFEDQQQYVYSEVNKLGGGGPAAKLSHTDFIVQTQNGAISYFEPTVVVATVDTTPPTLDAVSITSDNADDNTLAIPGNVVTLIFVASENIKTPDVTINGVAADTVAAAVVVGEGVDNAIWITTRTITTTDNPGTVTFTIAYSDLASNAGTPVTGISTGNTNVAVSQITLPVNSEIELIQDDLDVTIADMITNDANSEFALGSDNRDPTGITTLDGKLWVLSHPNKVHVHHQDGTLDDTSPGFTLHLSNMRPDGITALDSKLWIASSADDQVYVYHTNGTNDSDSNFSLHADNTSPSGITTLDGKFYITDAGTDRVYIYDAATLTSDTPLSEFALDALNAHPQGITALHGKLWVSDISDDKVYVYNPDGTRDADSDFDLASTNGGPTGITYLNGKLWVSDSAADKVFAYDAEGIQFDIDGLYANTSYEYTTTKCDVTEDAGTNVPDFDSCSEFTSQTSSDSTGALSIKVDGPFEDQLQYVFSEVKQIASGGAVAGAKLSHTDFIIQTQNGVISHFESDVTIPADTTKPTLDTVMIISNNNSDVALAVIGNVVTLSFESSEDIATPVVTINGMPATIVPGLDDTIWSATRTITTADPDGVVTFTINYSDLADTPNVGDTVTATTDGSTVTVDKTIITDDTKPTLDTVSITSDNDSYGSLATAGDVVTLRFEASEPIRQPVVIINGDAGSLTAIGGDDIIWSATRDITSTDNLGSVTFTITFTDLASNTGDTVTDTTTDGTGVTVYQTALPVNHEIEISQDDLDVAAIAVAAGTVMRDDTFDFDLNISIIADPSGITVYENKFYVTDTGDETVYAYNAATGTRVPGSDIDLSTAGNEGSQGITVLDNKFYVADAPDDTVYAYNAADGTRVPGSDITLNYPANNRFPVGIAAHEGKLWLVDSSDKVFVYNTDGTRDTSLDFDLDSANTSPSGIVALDGKLWITDHTANKVYVYDAATGTRAASYDFDLDTDNTSPFGITYFDGKLWVLDSLDLNDKVFAYNAATKGIQFDIFGLHPDTYYEYSTIMCNVIPGTNVPDLANDNCSENVKRVTSNGEGALVINVDGPFESYHKYVFATVKVPHGDTIYYTDFIVSTDSNNAAISYFEPDVSYVVTAPVSQEIEITQDDISILNLEGVVGGAGIQFSIGGLAAKTSYEYTTSRCSVIQDTSIPDLDNCIHFSSQSTSGSSGLFIVKVGGSFTNSPQYVLAEIKDARTGNLIYYTDFIVQTQGNAVTYFEADVSDAVVVPDPITPPITTTPTATNQEIELSESDISIIGAGMINFSIGGLVADTHYEYFTTKCDIVTDTAFNDYTNCLDSPTSRVNSDGTGALSINVDGPFENQQKYVFATVKVPNGDTAIYSTDFIVQIQGIAVTYFEADVQNEPVRLSLLPSENIDAVSGDVIIITPFPDEICSDCDFADGITGDVIALTPVIHTGDPKATISYSQFNSDQSEFVNVLQPKHFSILDPPSSTSFVVPYYAKTNTLDLLEPTLEATAALGIFYTDKIISEIQISALPADSLGNNGISHNKLVNIQYTHRDGTVVEPPMTTTTTPPVLPPITGPTAINQEIEVSQSDLSVVTEGIQFGIGGLASDTYYEYSTSRCDVIPGTVVPEKNNCSKSAATRAYSDGAGKLLINVDGPFTEQQQQYVLADVRLPNSADSIYYTDFIVQIQNSAISYFESDVSYYVYVAPSKPTVITTPQNTDHVTVSLLPSGIIDAISGEKVTISAVIETGHSKSTVSYSQHNSDQSVPVDTQLQLRPSSDTLSVTFEIPYYYADEDDANGNNGAPETIIIRATPADPLGNVGTISTKQVNITYTNPDGTAVGTVTVEPPVITPPPPPPPTTDMTKPTLDAVTIKSSNPDGTSQAIPGNTITLTFVSSEPILTPAVTINGVAASSVTGNGGDIVWSATRVITSADDTNGPVTFTIDYSDFAANAGNPVTATTDGTGVTVSQASTTADTTKPTLNTISITSNNSNDITLAKAGNTITLSFTSSEPIETPAVTINGNTADTVVAVGGDATVWSATRIITSAANDADGPVTFNIAFTDLSTNANDGIPVTVTSDGTSVTVDKMIPTLRTVTMKSSSSDDTSQAMPGDTITLTFISSEPIIDTPTVTINGDTVTATKVINNNILWSATKAIASGDDVDGPVIFNIAFTDMATNVGNPVSATTDGTGVTVSQTSTTITTDTTKPTLDTVTMTSNNSNDITLAKAGDTITLSFESSEDIETPAVTINGNAADTVVAVGGDATVWSATRIITSADDVDGPVTFNIAFIDLSTNANVGISVTGTTDSSGVTVDQMIPTLIAVSIASDNANDTTLATAGNTVTLSFTSSEPIQTPTVTFDGGAPIAATGSDITWSATKTITPEDSDGTVVMFTINYTDLALNPGSTVIGTTTDNSSVTIDQTGSSSSIPISEIQEENLGVTNTGGIKFSIDGLDASTYYQYTTSKCDVADPDDETCSDFAFAKRTNSNGELVIIMAGPFTNLQYVYAEVKEIGKADPIYRTSFTVQVQGNDIINFESVVSSVIPTEPVIPEPPTLEPPTPEPPTLDTTAPTLTAVSIESNNTNDTTLATAGNTVTLSFTSSEPIQTPTVTINGAAPTTFTGSSDTWSATKIITSTDTNGSTVMFTIDYTDLSSNAGAQVTGTTGGTSVTIDQTVTPTPPSTSQEIQEENLGVTNTGGIKFSIGGLDASTYYQYTTSKCDVADPDDETCSDFTFAKRTNSNGELVIIMAGPFTNLQYVFAEVKEIGKADPIYRTSFIVQVQGNDITNFESNVMTTEPVIPEPPTPEPSTPDTTAPTLTAVSIESNNTNDTTLATDGNTITLSFTSDEPILPPTVTINGDTVTATVLGGDTTTWSAETTIASTDDDGVVDFSITYSDLASNDGGIATSPTAGNPGVTVDNTAPTLTAVSIVSDNTDTSTATTDDTITLEFTSLEPIQTPTVTFGGISADTVNESGNTWSATKIITAADADGSAVTFDISFSDLATNAGTSVTSTTDSSVVTVYQTAPDTTDPELNIVSIESNNSDPSRATLGNTVTLSFTSSEPIGTPTVTINTVTATVAPAVAGSTTSWSATKAITAADNDGAVEFTIDFTDLATNGGTQVTSITTGSSVTVDQTAPELTTVSIESNNTNDTTLATDGNTITLSFTSDEPILPPTVTINGDTVTATVLGGDTTTWSAETTIASTDDDGVVDFSITYSDLASNDGGIATSPTAGNPGVTVDNTAPTLTAVSIVSDNTDTSTATTDDTITLEFTSLEPIQTPTVTFGGISADTVNESGNTWSATKIITAADADGSAVTFDISFSDLATNAGTSVTSTTDSSVVTVYQTAPDTTDPELNIVSIESNNSDPSRATLGNTVTLSFTSSEPIGTPTVTINTVTATVAPAVAGSTTSWSATKAITAADNDGAVEFTIDFTDLATNGGTQVTSITTGSSVTVDQTAPELTTVSIESNNTNDTTLATDGNTITLSFTSDEPILPPTVTINGDTVTATVLGGDTTTWSAETTIASTDDDGVVDFSITYSDLASNDGGIATSPTAGNPGVTVDNTAPTLTAVSIVSDNTDTSTATTDDTITLEFTSLEPIQTPTVTFGGISADTVNESGNTWSATKIITAADADGSAVTFDISFSDLATNAGTSVTSTTDSSVVTVYQTAPDTTDPELNIVSIESNNSDPSRATLGNTVTLSFTSSEPIGTPTVTINTVTATVAPAVAGSTTSWSATKAITAADNDGAVEFTIDFTDLATNGGTQVTSITTGSSVTVDQTAPELTTVSIESNNTNDTTLATDGNTITLSFTSDEPILPPTVTINGDTVTATVLGGDTTTWSAETTIASTDDDGVVDFSITYSDLASNDGGIATSPTAGNPGVTVDNTAPTLSLVTIKSSSSDNSQAMPGDTIELTFVSSEPINTPTVTINGDTVTATGNNNDTLWSATKAIASGDDVDGPVTFNIAFTDLATNVGIPIAATTDDTDVTVSQTSTTADTTKPTLRTVLLTSDNSVDNTLAIPGNTVTLSFTSDEPILPPTVTINGDTVTATAIRPDNTFWHATTVITPEDSPGAVTFEIAFTDLATNVGTPVTATTDGTGVTISQTVQYDLAVKGDGIRVKINGVFAERTYHEWSTSHCDVPDGNDCVDGIAREYSKDSGRVVIDIVDDDNNFADQRHVSISVKIPNTEDILYSTDFIVQVVNGEIVHEPDVSGVIPQPGNSGGNSNNNNNNNSDDGDSKTGSPSTITTKPTPSDRLLKNFIAAESDSDVIKQTDTAAIITAIITAAEPTTATATATEPTTATATATEPTTTATATEPTTTATEPTTTTTTTATATPDTTADTDTTTTTTPDTTADTDTATTAAAAPPSDTTLKNSNDDDDDFKTRPTFGISGQTFTQIVDCGYSMDGVCTDVTEYHVDYNRKIIQTGTAHDFALKAYAQNGMKSFVIGFGVNEVGAPASESEASITVNLGRDYTLDSTYVIDSVEYDNDENVIGENATFAVSGVSCGGGSGDNNDNSNSIIQKDQIQCTQLLIDGVLFREAMYDEPFMIEAVDAKRKVITHYMNEGLQVTGESINEPPTHKFSSKKTSQSDAVILELVRTDKLGNIWTDQFGYTWSADMPDEWYYVVGPAPDNSSACDSVDHRACDAFAAKVRWHNGNMESLRDSMYGDVYGAAAAKPFDDLDDAVTFLITPGESRTQFLDENAMMWIRN